MARSFSCVIPGNPQPKGRPRVAGHAYTDAKTRAAEESIRWQLKTYRDGPMKGNLYVRLEFWRADARRCDLDNLQKLVLDACNGVLWEDDSQIVSLDSMKALLAAQPRTVIEVREGF